MFLLDPLKPGAPADLVFSASDLVAASECEYRTLRVLDEKLGRSPKADFPADEMQARAGKLGDLHEHRVLADLITDYGAWDASRGTGVYCVERGTTDRADLAGKHDETASALRAGADVVFQATFFDGEFLGYADFLVKEDGREGGARHQGAGAGDAAGRYAVWDTKLARHAKVGALLQLAAYGDQLIKLGFDPAPRVTLVLGNFERSIHSLTDLLPVYRERRDRFRELTAIHRASEAAVSWQQPDVDYCGRCDYCAEQVAGHRDLLMVGGMTSVQRKKLIAEGVTSIDALAELPPEKATGSRRRLRDQARMQTSRETPDGARTFVKDGEDHTVTYKVLAENALASIPAPSDGDIFFDFEGDPLWQDPATGQWGLEYLFGVIEAPLPGDPPGAAPVFRPFWAHSRAGERQAFLDFLAYVEERRARYPDMHVYHYAPYEKTALRNLSLTHVAGEDVVDSWLREGVLVDLYATVRHSLRISEASYSIKKLEPLYMGDNLRSGDVKDAGASVVAYAAYCTARDGGPETQADAAAILASISDYNEYDCLSTLRLRDWLLQLRRRTSAAADSSMTGSAPALSLAPGLSLDAGTGSTAAADASAAVQRPGGELGTEVDSEPAAELTAEEKTLRAYLDSLPDDRELTADEQAVAMVAAATGYHRRERKQFWWEHFDRLESEVDHWSDQRNVFVVEDASVVSDWAPPTSRARTESRTLRLTGVMSEGSEFRAGSTWFRMFEDPLPDGLGDVDGGRTPRVPTTGSEAAQGATPSGAPAASANQDLIARRALSRDGIFGSLVEAVEDDPDQAGKTIMTITEKSSGKVPPYFQLPMALTPDRPIPTASIEAALAELAQLVGSTLPSLPRHSGLDILRRVPPRLATLAALPEVAHDKSGAADYISAITAALQDLDRSYLAVQGPPGTGKTYVGSHVIASLVQRGWKVGVVAQSHAVVENMLCTAIGKAGVDPRVVAKRLAQPHEVPWTCVADEDITRLLDGEGCCLIGGTAWTMTGKCVPAGSLDLLVIDEAGQYSLANTLAVARSARRLLLLGDPQQLPQVTQGSHPQPVDESALGWLSAGHATMPPQLGYFLADSWRMHPELCRAVSQLSYDGKLESAAAATFRQLAGVPAGVETVLVEHTGNTTSSFEEAARIVQLANDHIGLKWTPGKDEPVRPLEAKDILVVAAYNAQVQAIRHALDQEGLSEVRVGTVDKFQGQEAPVVLVSMACSAIAEAPRGAEFLLNRNRINVAVSRGQWRAVIVRSPELTNYMPHKPSALEELGAFIGLSPRGPGGRVAIA